MKRKMEKVFAILLLQYETIISSEQKGRRTRTTSRESRCFINDAAGELSSLRIALVSLGIAILISWRARVSLLALLGGSPFNFSSNISSFIYTEILWLPCCEKDWNVDDDDECKSILIEIDIEYLASNVICALWRMAKRGV